MTDDHSDENQNPDDVLRCPVCDAIFYHLDAYEVHLTYHSVDDMYSERSPMYVCNIYSFPLIHFFYFNPLTYKCYSSLRHCSKLAPSLFVITLPSGQRWDK